MQRAAKTPKELPKYFRTLDLFLEISLTSAKIPDNSTQVVTTQRTIWQNSCMKWFHKTVSPCDQSSQSTCSKDNWRCSLKHRNGKKTKTPGAKHTSAVQSGSRNRQHFSQSIKRQSHQRHMYQKCAQARPKNHTSHSINYFSGHQNPSKPRTFSNQLIQQVQQQVHKNKGLITE